MSEDGHRMDGSDGDAPINRVAGTVEHPILPGMLGGARRSESSAVDDSALGEGPALAKILPFPRDWFGPVEDLVPALPEPASGSAISAASFWDEDAGAVHQVVESLDRRWVGDGEGDNRVLPIPVPPEPDPAVRPAPSEGRRWLVIVAAGLGLALACAAVALLLLTGGSHQLLPQKADHVSRPAVHSKSAAALSTAQTVTLVVTTKVPVKPRRHRPRKVVVRRTRKRTVASHHLSADSSVAPAGQTVYPASSPASAAGSGAGASAAGGCVQSPDSGCMP